MIFFTMRSDTTRRYEYIADFRPGDKWGWNSHPPRIPTVRRGTGTTGVPHICKRAEAFC